MKIFNKVSIGSALSSSFALAVLGLVGPLAVHAATSPSLGLAAPYSVLSGAGATNNGAGVIGTTISGNLGVSPAAAFTDIATTPAVIVGTQELGNAAALAAQSAQLAVFNGTNPANSLAAADQPCSIGFGAMLPSLNGLTLSPGVYCTAVDFTLSGTLTLNGTGNPATDVWIFRAGRDLIASGPASVVFGAGGGVPCNVWWRLVRDATFTAGNTMVGNILAANSITFGNLATLDGRAFAYTAAVTMINDAISGPTCAAAPSGSGSATGSINVVKVVINDNGRTNVINDFPLFVNGIPVGPAVPNSFPTPATYTITETSNANYTSTFSGDCDATGHIALNTYESKVCIITNNDIGAPVVVPPVPPLIDVVKVPSPLSLPAGPGSVTYTYTLRNIGTVPVNNVTLLGDTCSPIVRQSGDLNNNNILEVNEVWVHTCTITLPATHTNTVTATGWANGIMATDIASATVIVGLPIVPPLIHVTKVPVPLALKVGGGAVTYTEKITNPGTVALSNVTLTDDKCSPMKYISGDTNLDSKLDTTEMWTYTCTSTLTMTTTNTAVATGQANGLTARDFAIVTVVVANAAPALPNTGVSSEVSNASRNIVLASIFAASAIFFILRKKQTV